MLSALLICATLFADSKTLALQIELDRRGYSCNAIDGQWGTKSQRAEDAFLADTLGNIRQKLPATPEERYDRHFAGGPRPFRTDTVTDDELRSLVVIPQAPAGKAALEHFGYASIQEMYAERGHMSPRGLARLNPSVCWTNLTAGTHIVLPDFPTIESIVAEGSRPRGPRPRDGEAVHVKVDLSHFEITAYAADGRRLAHFPCSIARDKTKVPQGELKIVSLIPNPNYTYTPDPGHGRQKHIFPAGPNNPVGVVWMGLSLPGYGIHGTPSPESVGCAESHGCFRLSNWNAARLFAMVRIGTTVSIEP